MFAVARETDAEKGGKDSSGRQEGITGLGRVVPVGEICCNLGPPLPVEMGNLGTVVRRFLGRHIQEFQVGKYADGNRGGDSIG
jgi:hypothetical protein